jgi:hypothetical protein
MEKQNPGYEFILPVGEELPHDTFFLLHQNGNSQHLTTFQEVLANNIFYHIVEFLRGCGHYDEVIYGCMQEISNEYFEYQDKKLKSLTPDSEELDSETVLG